MAWRMLPSTGWPATWQRICGRTRSPPSRCIRGLVLTEGVLANIQYFQHETNRETPLFVGRVVAALEADAGVFQLTGRWLVAAEVAESYGVTDEHGVRPWSNRAQILGGSTG